MAWFKVDDGFHASDKLMGIPARHKLAAAGLWVIAGSWAANQLTDGRVPEYMLKVWGATPAVVSSLVNAGLWEHEQGAYVFRSWHEYQPSKADVDAERAASRQRMRDIRAKRKQPKPQDGADVGEVFGRTVTNGSESVRNPDPTRPDPTHIEVTKVTSSLSKRGTRIDPAWIPDAALIEQMRGECPGVDLEGEHRKFIDHWIAQPGQKGVKLDWSATWRNWIRRSASSAPVLRAVGGKPSAGDKARSIADEFRKEGL